MKPGNSDSPYLLKAHPGDPAMLRHRQRRSEFFSKAASRLQVGAPHTAIAPGRPSEYRPVAIPVRRKGKALAFQPPNR